MKARADVEGESSSDRAWSPLGEREELGTGLSQRLRRLVSEVGRLSNLFYQREPAKRADRGRNVGYYTCEALHELRYVGRTLLILATRGKYLKSPAVKVRLDSNVYGDLFRNSEQFALGVLRPFQEELRSEFRFLGKVFNENFVSPDVEFYHCMIRRFCPSQIIEVGSGHSTVFAYRAARMNGTGSILSIDPAPRRPLPLGVREIRRGVEDVDVSLFKALEENDILLVDSSHTEQEAQYHIERILPSLNSGVLICHHDVMYPYVPFYVEEEILLRFYSEHEETFNLLTGLAYTRFRNPELLKSLVPSYNWNPTSIPGSLWVKKA